MALFFEDLKKSQKFTTPCRTITQTDISFSIAMTGHSQPIFVDEEYAKTTPFGSIIAPGEMTLGIEAGLVARMGALENTLGLLEIHLKYPNPVRIGDTLHAEIEVIDLKETSKSDRGVITFKDVLKNQKNEIVMEGTRVTMYKRRPKDVPN